MTDRDPGLYTEELIVKSKNDIIDRDFLHVRVLIKNYGRDISCGWVYHSPVRGVKSGEPVLFWER